MGTNKKIKQTAKKYLLTITAGILLFSSTGYGQSAAIPQPEVTGFEPINTSDMVNLTTGDFTYNLPLINVPGDGGGFSLPLSYHSGIEMDQEASWVGLGWSVNPGAINRNISVYPDDFNGVTRNEHYASDVLKEGCGINFIFTGVSYDSEEGFGAFLAFPGVFYAGVGTHEGLSLSLGPVTLTKNGADVDPVGVVFSIADLASIGAVSMVKEGSKAFKHAITANKVIGITNKALNYGMMAKGIAESQGEKSLGNLIKRDQDGFIFYSYEYYMNTNVDYEMYGSLYLNQQPYLQSNIAPFTLIDDELEQMSTYTNNGGEVICSDMHMYVKDDDYAKTVAPVSVAYDNYNVMGAGISGNIQPYNLSTNSLARVSYQDDDYYKYAILPSVIQGKIPFRYTGEMANFYQWHQSSTSDRFGFDFWYTNRLYNYTEFVSWPLWAIHDTRLKNSSDRISPQRDGLYISDYIGPVPFEYALAGSRFVNWYRNDEMGTASSNGYIMEYFPIVPSGGVDPRTNFPAEGIGGFAITRSDGLTYHYSLPVYNHNEKNYSASVGETKSYSISSNPYAVTWLLTAITGPDFVDRSETGIGNGRVDKNDWGYWVKFEYGKFGDIHKWISPLDGFHIDHENPNNKSVSLGSREKYYLDEIKTRTHTAVFVKDTRLDYQIKNRDIEYTGSTTPFDLQISLLDDKIFKSLYLNEIYLLNNKDYESLISGGLAKDNSSGTTINKLDNVWDVSDIISFRTELQEKQLNKVKFNYDYSLCHNSPECENAPGKGKLTLKSFGFFHRNNIKISPDYIFEYSSNPDYNKNFRDDWGMHELHDYAWNLDKITTPLGGEIEIEYERDAYSQLNGFLLYDKQSADGHDASGQEYYTTSASFAVGDDIYISGSYLYDIYKYRHFSKHTKIVDIVDGKIYLENQMIPDEVKQNGTLLTFLRVTLSNSLKEIAGGDVRTKSVTAKDENGNTLKTSYLYTHNGHTDGYTSGVCTIEPEGSRSESVLYSLDMIKLYDYPKTPIMYGKVSILTGNLSTNDDYENRTEYDFIAPHFNMLLVDKDDHSNGVETVSYRDGMSYYQSNNMNVNYVVDINTSQIGNVNSVKQFNSSDELIGETRYEYVNGGDDTSYSNIGKYTEGAILCESIKDENSIRYFRLLRTTKNYNPSIPKSVTTIGNGRTTTVTNTQYDLLSGNVLETEYYMPMGEKYRTQSVPAYTILEYSKMGFKAADLNNKNMLTQEAENYLYVEDRGPEKFVSASVQTWSENGIYADNDGLNNNTFSNSNIWRKHESYAFKGDLLSNGSFDIAQDDQFDHGATDAVNEAKGWQKAGEITLFNHYSIPLESKDINDNTVATKLGLNDIQPIATIANANYVSFGYTGFEEEKMSNGTIDKYGGGIYTIGTSSIRTKSNATIEAHTGNYYLNLNTSDRLTFRLKDDYEKGRLYRASIWVHESSSTTTLLKAIKEDNTVIGEKAITSADVIPMGEWKMLNLDFMVEETIPSGDMIFVEVSSQGAAYIDDFRVHPFDAAIASAAYDEHTGLLLASLNNDNLAIKYSYDEAGRLLATHKETPNGFIKVSDHAYGYAKQVHQYDGVNYSYTGNPTYDLLVDFDLPNNDVVARSFEVRFELWMKDPITVSQSIAAGATFNFNATFTDVCPTSPNRELKVYINDKLKETIQVDDCPNCSNCWAETMSCDDVISGNGANEYPFETEYKVFELTTYGIIPNGLKARYNSGGWSEWFTDRIKLNSALVNNYDWEIMKDCP